MAKTCLYIHSPVESPVSPTSQPSEDQQLSTDSNDVYEPHSKSESCEGDEQSEEVTRRDAGDRETGSNNHNINTLRDHDGEREENGGGEREGSNDGEAGEATDSSGEEDVIVQQV